MHLPCCRRRRVAAVVLACLSVACEPPSVATEGESARGDDDEWHERVAQAQVHAEQKARRREESPPGAEAEGTDRRPTRPAKALPGARSQSETRPPKAPKVERVVVTGPEDLSRRARREVSVTVYTTSWCGVCRTALRYMRARGIRFRERDVEHDPSASRLHRRLNPKGSVPTFDIDGQVMVGFSGEALQAYIDRATAARVARMLSGPKTIEVDPG